MVSIIRSLFSNNEMVAEIKELVKKYNKRQQGFNRWYELLSQKDTLAQENMESFVGNDPRTTWSMATFLLQPKPVIVEIIPNGGKPIASEARGISEAIQQYFTSLWEDINTKNLGRGQETWFWNFVGMLVATGWYAVPVWMEEDGSIGIDYWNPAQIYPEWSDVASEGLLRLARVRKISKARAESNILLNGWFWPEGRRMPDNPEESHLYKRVDGMAVHGVVIDNIVVKPLSPMGVEGIPILSGAVAGIPNFSDKSVDVSDTMGQSILATNEALYRSFNQLESFMMQLVRDTANPRVFEKSVGNVPIIKNAEDWYKRGAMFRGGPQDSLEVVAMPAIPVEVSQILFSFRNAIQRGSFSDLTFGNIIGEVSATLVTQAAEAAMQLITPYKDVVTHVTTESTNDWYQLYLRNPGLRPVSWAEIPSEILEVLLETHIETKYVIKIPGDLANRIAMAKGLNSNFELPITDLISMLLPEVTAPNDTIARLEAERAKLQPSYQVVQLIQAYEQLAEEARVAGNASSAGLFTALSEGLKKEITSSATVDDKVESTTDARL
ncbi:hypothetical protein LCGC14_0818250 [marine sediment metagenome]|uniref:Uncharacterized protein n=1 Tax=marine sediment metagenome TaxID=412755 RepID=A0A0F9S4L1_9ZZZZ